MHVIRLIYVHMKRKNKVPSSTSKRAEDDSINIELDRGGKLVMNWFASRSFSD